MNRGYRYSNAIALANYYADTRNTANFAMPGFLQSGINAAKRGAGYVDNAAQGIGGRLARNINSVGENAMSRVGKAAQLAEGAMGPMPANSVYTNAANRAMANRKRLYGYGAVGLGAAGLAAAGYAGARALRGRGQAPEMEEPEYAGYDPRRYLGG